ncbi:MAG: hypothetical protein AAF518_26575 [Spirochaetota bacterium]
MTTDGQNNGGINSPFEFLADVEPKYKELAEKTMHLFQQCFDEQDDSFDMEKAMAVVTSHTQMAITGTITRTVDSSDATASATSEKIKKMLHSALSESGIQSDQLQSIDSAFTDLSDQQEKPWFKIIKSSSSSTVYQFSFFLCQQNKNTGAVMNCSPFSLKITVNISKKVLFEKLRKEKATYKIEAKGLTIVFPLEQF